MSIDFDTNLAALRSAIDVSNRIVIIPHVNPDGDAIGSALALSHALKKIGKSVALIGADEVPKNLRFLPGWEDFQSARDLFPNDEAVDGAAATVGTFDLAIIADLSAPTRLAHARHLLPLAKQIAVIDHHELGDEVAEGILLIDPSYSATALLLFEVWDRLGLELSAAIAQCLLTGIATDTGGFKFQNTDAKSLHAAAELVKHGADITEIHEQVWDRKPLSAIRLLAVALANIQVAADGSVAYSRIRNSDYATANATDEDTEGIVNEIGKLDSAIVFALFREHSPGRVRVSVRSRGEIDVAQVCRAFGGGGHKNAAGCTFETGVDSAIDILLPALEGAVASTSR